MYQCDWGYTYMVNGAKPNQYCGQGADAAPNMCRHGAISIPKPPSYGEMALPAHIYRPRCTQNCQWICAVVVAYSVNSTIIYLWDSHRIHSLLQPNLWVSAILRSVGLPRALVKRVPVGRNTQIIVECGVCARVYVTYVPSDIVGSSLLTCNMNKQIQLHRQCFCVSERYIV